MLLKDLNNIHVRCKNLFIKLLKETSETSTCLIMSTAKQYVILNVPTIAQKLFQVHNKDPKVMWLRYLNIFNPNCPGVGGGLTAVF